jgi:hypothetical protein
VLTAVDVFQNTIRDAFSCQISQEIVKIRPGTHTG